MSLVGPSGCGKTTLLKILAGLQSYDSGEVRIGSPAHPFDPARDIGMVFQQALLLKWRRILENVLLPTEILGPAAAREPRPGAGAACACRPHRLRGQISLRALRRDAAARRDRARAGARSQADPDGRAVRRAGRADAGEDEPRAAQHLGTEPKNDRVRHPRHRGGGVSRHQGRGADGGAGAHGGQYRASTCRRRARSISRPARSSATTQGGSTGFSAWSEHDGDAPSRHHHERRHRAHGHEPASGPLDPGNPRGRRRGPRQRRPRDAGSDSGGSQPRQARGAGAAARARRIGRPISTPLSPTPTTPSSSTPPRRWSARRC